MKKPILKRVADSLAQPPSPHLVRSRRTFLPLIGVLLLAGLVPLSGAFAQGQPSRMSWILLALGLSQALYMIAFWLDWPRRTAILLRGVSGLILLAQAVYIAWGVQTHNLP